MTDLQLQKVETKVVAVSDNGEVTKEVVQDAILKGLKEETYNNAKKLLEDHGELEIINEYLIPALDTVGDLYEKQVIFLPQLINAANAASSAFELIKERIANKGEHNVSKGKIVVCTVKGDIHDIGKNIVKVILENYGYRMIDLGRDVDIQKSGGYGNKRGCKTCRTFSSYDYHIAGYEKDY